MNKSLGKWLVTLATFLIPLHGSASGGLADKAWNHGSEDCARNHDPAIEVYQRLAAFAKERRISAVLGTHIEISSSGKLFEAGSTYQPDEASLVLTAEDLAQLDRALQDAGSESRELAMAKFVVVPVGMFARVLGKVLGWLGVR